MAFESVLFPENHGEFSYTEPIDRGQGLTRMQTMIIDAPTRVPEEWAALMEALVNLVDAARVALRDPPEVVPSRG